jgi:hypothetical protein
MQFQQQTCRPRSFLWHLQISKGSNWLNVLWWYFHHTQRGLGACLQQRLCCRQHSCSLGYPNQIGFEQGVGQRHTSPSG